MKIYVHQYLIVFINGSNDMHVSPLYVHLSLSPIDSRAVLHVSSQHIGPIKAMLYHFRSAQSRLMAG